MADLLFGLRTRTRRGSEEEIRTDTETKGKSHRPVVEKRFGGKVFCITPSGER